MECLIFNIENEYGARRKKFIFDFNLIKKLDLSGVSFADVWVGGFDFRKSKGVKINPQTIFGKDFSSVIAEGVEFVGPFDEVEIIGTDFSGSKGAKINPFRLKYSSLNSVKAKDVEFIGSFKSVATIRIDFSGSRGAKIDPQEVSDGMFYSVIAKDVEFIGPFDGVLIAGTDFTGSKGAVITTSYTDISSCKGLEDVEMYDDLGVYERITKEIHRKILKK